MSEEQFPLNLNQPELWSNIPRPLTLIRGLCASFAGEQLACIVPDDCTFRLGESRPQKSKTNFHKIGCVIKRERSSEGCE